MHQHSHPRPLTLVGWCHRACSTTKHAAAAPPTPTPTNLWAGAIDNAAGPPRPPPHTHRWAGAVEHAAGLEQSLLDRHDAVNVCGSQAI
eukprot:scaffold3412_cov19-Tisochrysis_lutea.AAC.1